MDARSWRLVAAGAAAGAALATWLLRPRRRRGPSVADLDEGDDDDLRRLRKCEAIIRRRNDRVVVVVERCNESHNYGAVLRTAEALGYHHVWLVAPPSLDPEVACAPRNRMRKAHRWTDDEAELREHMAYAQRASKWLEIRSFATTQACVEALRADGRDIWVSELAQAAECFTAEPTALPRRLAIVLGTESTGASEKMLAAADRRVYLPLHGWADSLNLSVAAALLLQRLLDVDDTVLGDMGPAERARLRKAWYPLLARPRDDVDAIRRLAEGGGVDPLGDLRRTDAHRAGWVKKAIVLRNEASGFVSGIGTR